MAQSCFSYDMTEIISICLNYKIKLSHIEQIVFCFCSLVNFQIELLLDLSLVLRKLVLGFQARSVTNRAVQPQKMARGLKFHS